VVARLTKEGGTKSRSLTLTGTALRVAVLLFACTSRPAPPSSPTSLPPSASPVTATETSSSAVALSGTVLGSVGSPLSQATVRILAATNETVTEAAGRFDLTGMEVGLPVTVSMWKEGYYCSRSEQVKPPARGIPFTMRLVQTNDKPDYQWIPPLAGAPATPASTV